MDDIFEEHAHDNFMTLFSRFVDNLASLYPDCLQTKDVKTLFDGMIKQNKSKQKTLIDDWYKNLMSPMPKKIKYAKAVERIIGTPPILFHACAYTDIDAVEMTSESQMMKDLDVFKKYRKSEEKDRKIFWKYLTELNMYCFKTKNETPPYVPTRVEIQENIDKTKVKKQPEQNLPSMTKAFYTSYIEFCKQLGVHESETANEAYIQTLVTKWAEYAQSDVNGTKISVLCANKDQSALEKLTDYFPNFVFTDIVLNDELWNTIVQINSYSTVDSNIPQKMMGKIENLASRLADDIVNGRSDMSNMNLTAIGQEVLSQCDETDMSQFANNIDNLLPILQNLQKI